MVNFIEFLLKIEFYLKKSLDLLGKFNQAQAVDEGILMKYSRNKENIEVFSKGEEGILKKIPASIDFKFFEANNQMILLIKDKADHVEKLIEKNDLLYNQFIEFFGNVNLDQKIIEAKQKSAIPSQVVQIAIGAINPLFFEMMENVIIEFF